MSTYTINGKPFHVADGIENAYARRNGIVDAAVEHVAALLKELPPVLAWSGSLDALQQSVPEDKRHDPDMMHALAVLAAATVRLAQQR